MTESAPPEPARSPPPRPRSQAIAAVLARFAWPAAFVAIAAMTFAYLRDRANTAPPSTVTVAHAGPTVVSELRALARLETLSMHVEKIIDVKDHQARLRGLVEADDAVLFVASGAVVLGVDLTKLRDDDARFDDATKTAYITLPQPEVLSSRFDESRSYVHTRSTDLLAKRNEGLEASARREAIAAFEKAAREPDNLSKARANAETTMRALAKSWGAEHVVVTWQPTTSEARGEP